MAYLDVKPEQPNGRTVVLFHGKNFCAATWKLTIKNLVAAGYRVIAPDQIGFCKSSKPQSYQFTFKELAGNTHALLAKLGVEEPIVVGHSTGGMLAILTLKVSWVALLLTKIGCGRSPPPQSQPGEVVMSWRRHTKT